MKKLKIMLLSFALLAVVGGALAFKAKFITPYCTAAVNGNGLCTVQVGVNKFCPIAVNSTTVATGTPTWCYTVPQDLDDDGDKECSILNVATVRCITTPTTFAGN